MIHIVRLILLAVLGPFYFYCAIAGDYMHSEPPRLEACTPPMPGTAEIGTCNDLEWMQKRYLKEEGIKNRGIIFLETFELFVRKKGGKIGVYPFDITQIVDFFGKPDYQRNLDQHGNKVVQYAYLFDNHSNKDWACIITSDNKKVTSIEYSETKLLVFGNWKLLE